MTTTARNVGCQALPYASRQHACLAAWARLINVCTLQSPAVMCLLSDDAAPHPASTG
ncbi:hypothetical protein [Blastococcus mobilis]|uniref:Uncharacterized protein n=1 Tax=Blastococcus mobilis TaxID=1938746 RepID=A0A239B3D2_9ACTN|nr:hypothetical protein [Blastococcus mobilis]SNS02496.1 hypothetical protein SAMN06272737_1812 [Blastococcus mobilis]